MRLSLHSFFGPRPGLPSTPAQVGDPPSDGPLDESATTPPSDAEVRHSLVVRITHWINAICFLAFIESGTAILLAYPRLHWGETGTLGAPAKINLPLPFVLELGIRGPGRSIHFLTAWVTLFCGLIYLVSGLRSAHFYRHLVPRATQLRWNAVRDEFIKHLFLKRPEPENGVHYNLFQRVSYLGVVFVLMPFMFWTGLALSPSVTSVAPFLVDMVGGHQSARTLHFFSAILLVLFLIVHVAMVIRAGFWQRCRAMITGHSISRKESP